MGSLLKSLKVYLVEKQVKSGLLAEAEGSLLKMSGKIVSSVSSDTYLIRVLLS